MGEHQIFSLSQESLEICLTPFLVKPSMRQRLTSPSLQVRCWSCILLSSWIYAQGTCSAAFNSKFRTNSDRAQYLFQCHLRKSLNPVYFDSHGTNQCTETYFRSQAFRRMSRDSELKCRITATIRGPMIMLVASLSYPVNCYFQEIVPEILMA